MTSYVWNRPDRLDWLIVAIFWTAALPFIIWTYHSQKLPLWPSIFDGSINIVIDTIFTFGLVHVIFPTFFQRGKYVLFMINLLILMAIASVVVYYIDSFFFREEWNIISFNYLIYGILAEAETVGILGFMLISKVVFVTQKKVLVLEKEKKENELRMLKSQVDPHFLFNSLNILDVLIEKDTAQARLFLKRMSALYRYLLRHKDEDVVPLADELEFMDNYIYLIRQRFGNAYHFEQKNSLDDPFVYFIPPGALQTLVENAIKHNEGDEENPMTIHININSESVTVTNALRPKFDKPEGTRTGLVNLKLRYNLLTDQPIEVSDNGVFQVKVPLLRQVEG